MIVYRWTVAVSQVPAACTMDSSAFVAQWSETPSDWLARLSWPSGARRHLIGRRPVMFVKPRLPRTTRRNWQMPNDGAFTVGHGAVREDMTSVTIRVCDAATSHEGMAAVSAKRHRADDDDDDDPLALCSLPLSLTNFSIREILKPNFGCGQTTGRHHSAFSVCLPRRRLEATTTLTTTTTTTTTGDVTRRTEATPIRHTTNGKKDKCDKLTGDDGAMTAADPLKTTDPKFVWPAWVYCTRYTDRPSAGKFVWPAWVYCTRYTDRPSVGKFVWSACVNCTRYTDRPPAGNWEQHYNNNNYLIMWICMRCIICH